MAIYQQEEDQLSEKQLVIHSGKAIESGPGIGKGHEGAGQAGAKNGESTPEKTKNSCSYRNRWSRRGPEAGNLEQPYDRMG
jgi:hypothetical protein